MSIINVNLKNSKRHTLNADQSGINLLNKLFYDDKDRAKIKTTYLDYTLKVLYLIYKVNYFSITSIILILKTKIASM